MKVKLLVINWIFIFCVNVGLADVAPGTGLVLEGIVSRQEKSFIHITQGVKEFRVPMELIKRSGVQINPGQNYVKLKLEHVEFLALLKLNGMLDGGSGGTGGGR